MVASHVKVVLAWALLVPVACSSPEGGGSAPTPSDAFDVPIAAPTPPGPNDVVFSPPGGGFVDSTVVQLSTPSGSGVIHYTLDGSPPTASSPVYDGPLTLTGTTLIHAVSVTDGATLSPSVFTATYVALEADVASFSSNLPIVILERHGDAPIEEESNELRVSSVLTFETAGTGRAALNGPATSTTRAGVRVRGQSSRGFPQKSYAVEFWQGGSDDDRDAVWLGMPADSDWVLLAPSHMDRSLMRNMLAMDLSRQLGSYAPRTRFVEVFLVDRENAASLSSDDYLGVYTAGERIKRGPNRVNIAKLDPTDVVEPNVSGGYLFRIDHEATDFDAGGYTFGWVYPDSDEFSDSARTAQRDYLVGHLGEFFDALRSDDFQNDQGRHYSDYIDVPAWIDHNWLNALLKNVDGLRLSAYFYKDRGGPIVAGPVWDFDRSAGTPHDGRAVDPREWGQSDGTHPLTELFWGDLFADPTFASAYWTRWDELAAGTFSVAALHALLDGYDVQLAEARERHFERWSELPPVDGPEGEVRILRDFLAERVQWLGEQRP